ncbi:unnamed protein product [Parnassius mnemosyne]|uniref:PiggyBac transposable element-derived protein domain-containing protein n=1 Tax=Parnassius mnemosyne TaxID=213953 RepID=A0AAV1KIM4_9NEOP
MSVYCGKTHVNAQIDQGAAEKVVMSLVKDLLDDNRILYTDNYYTSIPLAYRLKHRKTNLVGTLRLNRKHLPKDLVTQKLKKGEIIAKETTDGKIGVTKWKDKRVVTTLSTVNSAKKMTAVKTKRGQVIFKPDYVVDYNTGKSSIDVSDQMASYASALRRCTKLYRKLAMEFIWGTSLVNAYFLYNECSRNKKITIMEFREKVIEGLIDKFVDQSSGNQPPSICREAAGSSRGAAGSSKETIGSSNKHLLVNFLVGRPPKLKRGRCKACYAIYGKKGMEVGGKRKYATQVQTICNICKSFYCRNCFNLAHK